MEDKANQGCGISTDTGASNPLSDQGSSFGVWPLHWDLDESRSCVGQAVITKKGTNEVWISCTTSLLRGKIVKDERGRPVSMVIETTNLNALAGLQDASSGISPLSYGHIGDGDYVDELDEIWFGLEDGNWPRELNAAIIRYDAYTLEYKGIHAHPTQKFLAWLVYDQRNQRAYGSDWEGVQDLVVFDMVEMKWLTQNLKIRNLPLEYLTLGGINYIQGGDMKDDILYLMSDDFRSSLFALRIDSNRSILGGEIVKFFHLGLGNEREGIALLDGDYILSLGNRWRTWENHSFSELLCLPSSWPDQSKVSSSAFGEVSFLILGFFWGVAVSWVVFCFVGGTCRDRRERRSYLEVPTEKDNIELAANPQTLQ